MTMRWLLLIVAAAALTLGANAFGHDARPAYLQVEETAPGRYDILWRTPVYSGMPLPVKLTLPAEARNVTAPNVQELPDSTVERRIIAVAGGLAGKRIEFPGLQGTITDVLVRVQRIDGSHQTILVRPSQPWIEVEARQGTLGVVTTFAKHGVEHILLGYDHLLFVFALMLIVRSPSVLVWTITSFTLAHSITLALATLSLVHVPGPPVEAAIALSIVLLASEIVRIRRGEASLTQRWPWVVAFSFGLLHGFGFAGALSEIGLPQGDIPLALFAFNVGVELGQLAFIAAMLAAFAGAKRLGLPELITGGAYRVATLAIGSLAAFWFIERVAGF